MVFVVVMECYYSGGFFYIGVGENGGNIGILSIFLSYFFVIEFEVNKCYNFIILFVDVLSY